MQVPSHAPSWVKPVIRRLEAEGFAVTGEGAGGMQGYQLLLTRGDLTVYVGADRGEWWLDIHAPNPQRGRGHPRVVQTSLDVFIAALRGDQTPDALFDVATVEKSADWLLSNVDVLLREYRQPRLWQEIDQLKRARSREASLRHEAWRSK